MKIGDGAPIRIRPTESNKKTTESKIDTVVEFFRTVNLKDR